MKTSTLLTALSLAGLCVMPLTAQDTAPAASDKPASASASLADKAAALAADKNADIGDICNALYKAVQADPNNAHNTLALVLERRDSWTANQVHALVTATMMGCPELVRCAGNGGAARAGLAAVSGEKGGPVAVTGEKAGLTGGTPMLRNIIDVLYWSPSVSDDVVSMVVTNIDATSPSQLEQTNQNVNAGDTSSGGGQNTNATPIVDEVFDVVPGPDDVSRPN